MTKAVKGCFITTAPVFTPTGITAPRVKMEMISVEQVSLESRRNMRIFMRTPAQTRSAQAAR